jgi:dTDP-4-amino-4,6-dideoxygalactose transaminase
MSAMTLKVPYFRPDIGEAEITEVCATLRSGWLTTGPKVSRFEEAFKAEVHASHALAVNSCTSALHLALEALGTVRGDAVLVPTMTFAATAEVVRYQDATPILVDCDPESLMIDLDDAQRKIEQLQSGRPVGRRLSAPLPVGIMPVHVGGLMMDVEAVQSFAVRHRLWIVDDAAHAFPAAWRKHPGDPWRPCGDGSATATCFSFYANKTITTGEGGMVVTNDDRVAERMRIMALHGLSADAWGRYSGTGCWDYKIMAPGFKYNFTDIAAAIGLHQLARAEEMRLARERIALRYFDELSDIDELELPRESHPDRIHAWHLFPVRLRLHRLDIDRSRFMEEMAALGIGCSVHWRPLHLHPYYRDVFGYRPEDFPAASTAWARLISLPLFSAMTEEDVDLVVGSVRDICRRHLRISARVARNPQQPEVTPLGVRA